MASATRSERVTRWLWLGPGLLMLGIGACFACGDGSHGTEDGGSVPDAGSADGATDALVQNDAGRDAGRDDAGSGSTFVHLEGLPGWCDFRVATDPAAIPPLRWTSCFDGREDCEQLVVDWGDTTRDSITLTVADAYNGSDGPMIAVLRPRPFEGEAGFEFLAIEPEGHVIHATRSALSSDRCGQGHISGSQTTAAYTVYAYGADPRGAVATFVVVVDISGRTLSTFLLTRDDLSDQGTQDIKLAETGLIGLEISPALRVGTLRDGTFHFTDAPGAAHNPVPIGEVLLFDSYDSPRRSVMKENPDLSVEPYVSVPDADVMQLRSDGEWLAWMEGGEQLGSSTHWATRTLRAARFTPDGAALEPRTVAELGEGWLPHLGVGGGWVVAVDRTSLRPDVLAVNIETGEERRIPPPDGHAFQGNPVYITATEVALRVAHLPSLSTRTVFKIPLVD